MRIVFLGTPDFAVLPFKAVLNSGNEVIAAVTNKDKPFGRKQILTPCPVKTEALNSGVKVLEYDKIRLEGLEDIKALKPDLMITCAFGQILSKEILAVAKYGTLNIHASLLPKYRGASPIHYAILNGEKETGITIMRTDEGIDTGDILLQKKLEIKENETCGELFSRLSVLGAECILEALKLVESGNAVYTKQGDNASYTKIIKKEDALIDFNKSAYEINNMIRAFNPKPTAYTILNGEPLKIFSAVVANGKGNAGEILECDNTLEIACKEGSLKISELQKSGSVKMETQTFLRGNHLKKGEKLGK